MRKESIRFTLSPSAVQSETCQPWSWSEKVQDPFELCLNMFSKSPEGLFLTFEIQGTRKINTWLWKLKKITYVLYVEEWYADYIYTCEFFIKSCPFLRVSPVSSSRLQAKSAWTAKPVSHCWLPKLCNNFEIQQQ